MPECKKFCAQDESLLSKNKNGKSSGKRNLMFPNENLKCTISGSRTQCTRLGATHEHVPVFHDILGTVHIV